MKILKKFIIVLALVMLIIPFNVKAEETYKSLNLDEVLTEEEIDHDFSNYEENDDQITIYLFRGKGCGYCRKFLTFLDSIVDDYGKYFKVVSYEVWYNEKNASLLDGVSKLLDESADGVPYIVIGDKVFAGYSENYDNEIKSEIKKLYDTKKSERYDVMQAYEKESKNESNNNNSTNTNFSVIAFNVIFAIALAVIVFVHDGKKRSELEERIEKLETQLTKKTTTKKEK